MTDKTKKIMWVSIAAGIAVSLGVLALILWTRGDQETAGAVTAAATAAASVAAKQERARRAALVKSKTQEAVEAGGAAKETREATILGMEDEKKRIESMTLEEKVKEGNKP